MHLIILTMVLDLILRNNRISSLVNSDMEGKIQMKRKRKDEKIKYLLY